MLFSYELTAWDHDCRCTAVFSSCKLCLDSAMQLVLQLLHIGPYLRGLRDQSAPSKCSPQKFSTLPVFQHISAVAVVNIVTVLWRSIVFSVHPKRSATLKKCWNGVCCRSFARNPAGGAQDAPQIPKSAGEGSSPPKSPPIDASFQWTVRIFFLHGCAVVSSGTRQSIPSWGQPASRQKFSARTAPDRRPPALALLRLNRVYCQTHTVSIFDLLLLALTDH